MKEIELGLIKENDKYGKAEIIEDLGYTINPKRRMVKIKFLDTGYETDVRYDAFLEGKFKDEYYGIDKDKIYYSNSYGPVKVLDYVGRGRDNRVFVKAIFLNSGCITDLDLRQLIKGTVSDPQHGVNFNSIYQSKLSGPFRFLEILDHAPCEEIRALVQFTLTNNIKNVSLQAALMGKIKDDLNDEKIMPNINEICNYDKWLRSKLYSIWQAINLRCNDSNHASYERYGGAGVTLDKSWENFENFYNDAFTLPQFEKFFRAPMLYQLDKDFIQKDIPKSNRVYSKETCMFLHFWDNSNMATVDRYRWNPESVSSKYYGVTKTRFDTYRATLNINSIAVNLGIFDEEIYAAAAYNYRYEHYHHYELIPLHNDVPFISPDVYIKHNLSAKQMYTIINN